MTQLPIDADIALGATYDKKVVEHIFKIETDQFKPCTPKTIKKRKNLFFQQLFVVHVKHNGQITWEELK